MLDLKQVESNRMKQRSGDLAMRVSNPPLVGQPTLDEVNETLSKANWQHVTSVDNKGVKGEVNAFFVANEKYAGKVNKTVEAGKKN